MDRYYYVPEWFLRGVLGCFSLMLNANVPWDAVLVYAGPLVFGTEAGDFVGFEGNSRYL